MTLECSFSAVSKSIVYDSSMVERTPCIEILILAGLIFLRSTRYAHFCTVPKSNSFRKKKWKSFRQNVDRQHVSTLITSRNIRLNLVQMLADSQTKIRHKFIILLCFTLSHRFSTYSICSQSFIIYLVPYFLRSWISISVLPQHFVRGLSDFDIMRCDLFHRYRFPFLPPKVFRNPRTSLWKLVEIEGSQTEGGLVSW